MQSKSKDVANLSTSFLGPNRGDLRVLQHMGSTSFIEQPILSQFAHECLQVVLLFFSPYGTIFFPTAIWVGDKAGKTMQGEHVFPMSSKFSTMTSAIITFNTYFSSWQCTITDNVQVSVTKNNLDLKKKMTSIRNKKSSIYSGKGSNIALINCKFLKL